ncbi:unnamed protein product [Lampetra planeri]
MVEVGMVEAVVVVVPMVVVAMVAVVAMGAVEAVVVVAVVVAAAFATHEESHAKRRSPQAAKGYYARRSLNHSDGSSATSSSRVSAR